MRVAYTHRVLSTAVKPRLRGESRAGSSCSGRPACIRRQRCCCRGLLLRLLLLPHSINLRAVVNPPQPPPHPSYNQSCRMDILYHSITAMVGAGVSGSRAHVPARVLAAGCVYRQPVTHASTRWLLLLSCICCCLLQERAHG